MHQHTKLLLVSLTSISLTAASDPFNWASITPSKELEYHCCYSTFQCARLILPLDYKSPRDPRTVTIAITKAPASVPDDDPKFGGSVFLNPGGPGGSATDLARGMGPDLQRRLERSGRRHYEYIGIDGRGIGHSLPSSNCFPRDLMSRHTFNMESRGAGLFDESERGIRYGLALNDGFGERCWIADKSGVNGGQIMAYAGTASVARDMVEVADKIAQLRSRQRGSDDKPNDTTNGSKTLEDVARVQYVGFSYGTILGHYFASMFPERVGRLVLDGVMDPNDYATGPGWTTNLVDTDKLYWAFFESCHNAGPSKCAMARNSDESGIDIERRFREWLISLDNNPLASIGPSGDVRVLAGNDIRAYMGTAFYAPLATFPSMASEFDNAIRGNASKLFETYFQAIAPYRRTNECLYDDGFGYTGGDAGYPVRCGDGDDVTGMDVSWWHTYAKNLVSSSSLFGAFWASKRFVCSGWKLKSNWRFTGPFTSPKFRQDSNGNPRPGYPAAPNLYLSSKIDPVTPVAAARRMQKYYPGAGLAILDAVGHTALGAGAKNKCLEKIVGQYLETGIVPKEDVLCPSDCGPWDKGCELGYVI